MNSKLLRILILLFPLATNAQNVGIGIANPLFRLDIRNGSINSDSLYRIGSRAVLSIKGLNNIFIGDSCGRNLTSGDANTGCGKQALDALTSGRFNTAVGSLALKQASVGFRNTAFGDTALLINDASYNTAFGKFTLWNNTSGTDNLAIGRDALSGNGSGNYNTAVGSTSHFHTAASDGNTAIGRLSAGEFIQYGYYNTCFGLNSRAFLANMYNSVAVGTSALAFSSLEITIGNTSITSIGGYQNWTSLSDGAYKQNIKENVKGLEFIRKLRPVTYNLDVEAIREKIYEGRGQEMNEALSNAIAAKQKELQTGFIAQEVEKAAIEVGYDFSGVDKPKNENGFYGLRYAEFVVPLVKAMQEQQQQIESLLINVKAKEAAIAELKLRLDVLEKTIGNKQSAIDNRQMLLILVKT